MPSPLEVYNKRIKKREKEKRKKARFEVRSSKKLLEEPEKLKKELDELTHKAIIGRIDPESLERKEKIEKLWEQYTKNKQLKERQEQYESESSEDDDSSEESSSSDDEKPKCVIEIAGEVKKEPVKRKGFHDPDEFELEQMKNVPKLNNENESKIKVEPKKINYTPRPVGNTVPVNIPYTLNAPPPPVHFMPPFPMPPNFVNLIPPPPPPMMNFNANLNPVKDTHEEKEVKEKIPLSKYFVPSQVRLNRKNPDKKPE